MEEEDLVTYGYLTSFSRDIDTLLNNLTGYRAIILRLGENTKEIKDVEKSLQKMDEQLKQALIQWSDAVRTSAERSYVEYKSLIFTIPNLRSDKLDEIFNKIINIFCPDLKDVFDFTTEIHNSFVRGMINERLKQMEAQYEQYAAAK